MLELYVRVVAVFGRLLGPHEVGPPSVCAAAPVPGQIGFGVDRPIWLSRDGVEPAYGAVCDEDRRVEAGPAEAVGVHRREDVGSTLSTFVLLVRHHHLTARPDGGIAVIPVPTRVGNVLGRSEAAVLAEPRARGSERVDLLPRGGRIADPDAIRSNGDRRLIAAGRDVRDLCERHSAVGRESEEDVEVLV